MGLFHSMNDIWRGHTSHSQQFAWQHTCTVHTAALGITNKQLMLRVPVNPGAGTGQPSLACLRSQLAHGTIPALPPLRRASGAVRLGKPTSKASSTPSYMLGRCSLLSVFVGWGCRCNSWAESGGKSPISDPLRPAASTQSPTQVSAAASHLAALHYESHPPNGLAVDPDAPEQMAALSQAAQSSQPDDASSQQPVNTSQDMPSTSQARRPSIWESMKQILQLSIPLAVTNVSGYSLNTVTDAMIGRLGASALSTSTLANSFYGMMGISVIWGGAAGMETLAGQAYGAGNTRVMHLVLLRALIVCWCLCIPSALAWQHAEWLMIQLGQSPTMAASGAVYLQALVPSLFLYVLAECLQSCLVCQNNVKPATFAKGVTAVVGPVFYYVLMFQMNLGLSGAAYAYALCKLTNALLLIGWMVWQGQDLGLGRGSSQQQQEQGTADSSSQGSSSAALASSLSVDGQVGVSGSAAAVSVPPITLREIFDPRGCWEFIKYGLPSAAMTLLEWWAYEINVLLAGTLPNAEVAVAVLGICLSISGWVYMFPQSIATATCTRISNSLGSGDARAARSYFWSAIIMVACQQGVLGGAVLLGGTHLVDFFCQDPAVMSIALGIVPIVACNVLADGLNVVLNGVLRACGRQALGARLQLCSYWLLGVPLSWLLGVKSGMGISGFMTAIGITSFTQAIVCSTVISRFNWRREVARSQQILSDMTATMSVDDSSSKED